MFLLAQSLGRVSLLGAALVETIRKGALFVLGTLVLLLQMILQGDIEKLLAEKHALVEQAELYQADRNAG